MILKKCEFCGKQINAKTKAKRFCNPLCQRKHYNRRPEIREKYKIRMREYRKNNPDWKIKHRILAVTKYREQRRKYWGDYGRRPEVRKRINKKDRERRKVDKEYVIADRLRRSLNHAMKKYSKTGKIMSSRKYGIDWKEIIESLKPFPEEIENFEIDHIIPLCTFNLTEVGEIKKAFSPSNLQWLTREENRIKSGKILKDINTLNNSNLSKIRIEEK
jgi:hypothetical protein